MLTVVRDRTATGVTIVFSTAAVQRCRKNMEKLPTFLDSLFPKL
jgi:hypothetical protein